MRPFFASPDRIALLDLTAQQWEGTPFRHNSCVRKVGANCVLAVAGVLKEAGFAVPTFDLVPTSWSRHQTESKMEKWLDAHPDLFGALAEPSIVAPGDVVGFKVGLCIHHLGLILPGERFFQCNETMGARILSCAERLFRNRLARVWRPLEH